MINLNSPTVQSMLANTPAGTIGNMPVGYGNAPTVETVYPSPQRVSVSPYPSPYEMITGAGLKNYLPTYNFTGALSGPSYMDNNQPVMGGLNLPVGGYTNPYMSSFTGGIYGPLTQPVQVAPNAYTPYKDRWVKYMYASPEDRFAMDNGFHSMADMQSNEVSIMSRLSIMAHKAIKSDESIIEEIKECTDKKIAEIEGRAKKTNEMSNPFNLKQYEVNNEAPTKKMHIKIIVNNKVVCEMGGENGFTKRVVNNGAMDHHLAMRHEEMKVQLENFKAQKYATAPERQFDKQGLIDFFNEGFGVIHYYDRQREWDRRHDVSRLFDSNEFRRALLSQYGTPQVKRKLYREDTLNFRGEGQVESDLANGLIRGGYGYMPNGQPLSPGVDPNIGSAISYDLNTGGLRIQMPPELENLSVTNQYTQRAMSARERFLAQIGRD